MVYKIALLTSDPICDFILKTLAEFNDRCEFIVYNCSTSAINVCEIYDNLPIDIDGIFASGILIEKVIKDTYGNIKYPIVSLKNDDTGIYKLFYTLLKNNRDLDLSRVYADPFDGIELDLEEYLDSHHGIYSDILTSKFENLTVDDIYNFEQEQYNKHLNLWENGKIDLSITRFGNSYKLLKEKGLPIYFLYPGIDYIKSCLIRLLQLIDLKNMDSLKPAVINIALSKNYDLEYNFQKDNMALHDTIVKYNPSHLVDCMIQKTRFGFEILTEKKNILDKAASFSNCNLQKYLLENLGFPVNIGYGIGNNIYQARINALDANKESAMNNSAYSYLVSENDELIKLDENNQILYESKVIADEIISNNNTSLSSVTIQKVVNVFYSMPNRHLTARELALKLNITQRSANRFLKALEKSNIISIIKTKKTTTKGRPERVYELILSQL